jgi:hypothetical protein
MRTTCLVLFTILCLMLAAAPAIADTLYNNGPYNGTTDAWSINFGFAVSDSFSLSGCPRQGCSVEDLHIVYWDASSTDLLTSVDMAFGATSFGGTFQTLSGATNQFISTNQYGYFLYSAWFTFANLGSPNGTSYVTLQNACSTSGCSVSNPIYWDENSGPSTAYENTLGSIPSEAFTLTSGQCGDCLPTPEPSGILLFGSGILGLGGILRRWLFGISKPA